MNQSITFSRSIPAHAGEPWRIGHTAVKKQVDPRARGGASIAAILIVDYEGRSPRTRGSQNRPLPGLDHEGSIPAHAGEPVKKLPDLCIWQVDPRARGGARISRVSRAPGRGRSPRTRGSLAGEKTYTHRARSIPAHAGEPGKLAGVDVFPVVDPRARGGAITYVKTDMEEVGRSPRTRGSHIFNS